MPTKQLNYKALPIISTFDGSTSPTLTANDKGVMAFSTLSNKPFYWNGTQWRVTTAEDATIYCNYNIAIGAGALDSCNGSNNIAIFSRPPSGNLPVFNITTENNIISMGGTAVTNAYIQVAWTVVSDARDKTNFKAIPHGLDFVKQLKPTAYQFRESRESEKTNGGVRYGFKAQDIAAIEPEAVIVDTTNSNKLYYNESNLIPILVKAIQELSAEVERLKNANPNY